MVKTCCDTHHGKCCTQVYLYFSSSWMKNTMISEKCPQCRCYLLYLMWYHHPLWVCNWFFSFVSGKSVFQKGRAIDTGEVEIGAQVMQTIPPGLFWRFQITIHHPMYLKFNISLAKDSLLGIYGRRNIPPTHTQVITSHVIVHYSFKEQWLLMFSMHLQSREEERNWP